MAYAPRRPAHEGRKRRRNVGLPTLPPPPPSSIARVTPMRNRKGDTHRIPACRSQGAAGGPVGDSASSPSAHTSAEPHRRISPRCKCASPAHTRSLNPPRCGFIRRASARIPIPGRGLSVCRLLVNLTRCTADIRSHHRLFFPHARPPHTTLLPTLHQP